jgi:formate dehydrogenase subunit gamma
MHWFNAVCWFFLLATGLGLIKNTELNPIGGWWPNLMRALFGSGEALLASHVWCGLIWAGLFILYIIVRIRKEVVPFIKQIFTFSPRNDLLWVIKKGIQMTMGYKMLEKLGFEPKLPDQGFYNVGQKLFAIPAVLGGTLIAATGIIMLGSKLYDLNKALVQWSILIHFVVVGIVTAGLLIHIFMAAIASGEFPALVSMFTGTVPEAYARHHHKLWYDEVKG